MRSRVSRARRIGPSQPQAGGEAGEGSAAPLAGSGRGPGGGAAGGVGLAGAVGAQDALVADGEQACRPQSMALLYLSAVRPPARLSLPLHAMAASRDAQVAS